MGIAYQHDQKLTSEDLFIRVFKEGFPAVPAAIYYDLINPHGFTVYPTMRTPKEAQVGLYYAAIMIPPNFEFGEYKIKWTWQLEVGGPQFQSEYRFHVVGRFTVLNNDSLRSLVESSISGIAIRCNDGIVSISGNYVYIVLGDGQWLPQTPFYIGGD